MRFVVLPDGTLIAPASIPDGVLFPIADAIEATVQTPYEVEAQRISGDQWGAVGDGGRDPRRQGRARRVRS